MSNKELLKITLKMADKVKSEEGGSQEWLIQTLLFGVVFLAPNQLADNNKNNKKKGVPSMKSRHGLLV